MTSLKKETILIVGFSCLHSDYARKLVLNENYNLIKDNDVELCERYKNDIIGVLLIYPINGSEIIYTLPNLKIVSCNSSGLNHLDLDKLYSKNIKVTNCPEQTADSTSEIGIILMLNLSRKIFKVTKTYYYSSFKIPFDFIGNTIRGKILGIIGLGSVGEKMALKATLGFGMKVVYHQRHKKSECQYPYYDNLDAMLSQVDFLTISCPLTDSTEHLINIDKLKLMKPTAFLINIARGKVIKTSDLVEALKSGFIAGAGLDVTDPESLEENHPLLNMDNVIVLPHIGTFTIEARNEMLAKALENLRNYLQSI